MRFLLYSLADADQSSSFAAVKITAMGFDSGPNLKIPCKKSLMGFVHQETFQVHSQEEEVSAVEPLTDQTTPG